jgi:hypothetical protein
MKKIWVNRNYTFHMAVRYAEPFQIDPNKGVEDRFHLNIGYYYVSLGDGKFHLASEEVAYTFFFPRQKWNTVEITPEKNIGQRDLQHFVVFHIH